MTGFILQIICMAAVFAVSFIVIAGKQKDRRNARRISAVAVVCMLLAVALYSRIGAPGLGDAPLAARQAERTAALEAGEQKKRDALAALEAAQTRARANPDDIVAQLALAEAAARAGQTAIEIAALESILALGKDGDKTGGDAAIKALLAEALSRQQGGIITPKALGLIESALADDPADVRARYLKGVYLSQSGDDAGALQIWIPLAADVAGTPLFGVMREAVLYAADRLGHDVARIDRELEILNRKSSRTESPR